MFLSVFISCRFLGGNVPRKNAFLAVSFGLAMTASFVVRAFMKRRDFKRYEAYYREVSGLCLKCGYSLTGNVSGACTECGATIK